ncbi:MAG: ribonuclease J [Clostridiales Family XIII bacterium]|jgi:ribonuclease J|nr:ribonuclease J [Clostridiales Family XIII bacterium]
MAIDLRRKNRGADRTRVETAVKQAAGGKKKRGAQAPQASAKGKAAQAAAAAPEHGAAVQAPTQGANRKPGGRNAGTQAPTQGANRKPGGRNAGAQAHAQGGRDAKQQPQPRNRGSAGRDRRPRPHKPENNSTAAARAGVLEIIPIGGLGEIGKNLTAFRYGDEILIVDCGMSFPDDEMFGIDVVIPEFSFLEEHQQDIKGLVVTHGHEDHIGGIPFLLKKIKPIPIYGTRLTLGLIGSKLQEHGVKGDFRHIEAGQRLKIGNFRVDTIRATHSVADSISLAIETPAGTVFHTGDFKIDYTPIDGDPMDFQKLAEIGSRGVDLMLCDSTNALRKGFTESEKKLGPVLDKIFDDAKSRVIIATFASNVHRVQTIINTAVRHKRKIALSGRSMLRVMEIAENLGYLSIPEGTLVDLNEIGGIQENKLVIITTGSQGEPMSALTRMAAGEHKSVRIRRGDTVILSSSPIPGNEKTVSGVVNSLIGLGADVIYSDIADIHVSGHASQEEIKVMISLIRPKYFMPVHGENKHLLQNASIAENLGIAKDHIIACQNGSIAEMENGACSLTKRTVPAAAVFVDGLGVGDIGTSVLKDRKQLSESGLIIVTATIDNASGFVIAGPEAISRGFVYEKTSGDLIEELRQIAEDELEAYERGSGGTDDRETLKNKIRNALRGHIYARTGRSPVILTILMEA